MEFFIRGSQLSGRWAPIPRFKLALTAKRLIGSLANLSLSISDHEEAPFFQAQANGTITSVLEMCMTLSGWVSEPNILPSPNALENKTFTHTIILFMSPLIGASTHTICGYSRSKYHLCYRFQPIALWVCKPMTAAALCHELTLKLRQRTSTLRQEFVGCFWVKILFTHRICKLIRLLFSSGIDLLLS